MASSSAFFILLFFTSVFSQNDFINLTPCALDDMDCFGTMTQQFIQQTYKGIPGTNIEPIDPLTISRLDIDLQDEGAIMLYFRNVTIKGLKDEVLHKFKLNTNNKRAMLQVEVDPNIFSDSRVVFRKESKSFSGDLTLKGKTIITAVSDYDIVTDDVGVKHLNLGPETLKCKVLGKLDVTLSPGIRDAVNENRRLYRQKVKGVYCKILKKAYSTVINNVREAAKILPKDAFVKSV